MVLRLVTNMDTRDQKTRSRWNRVAKNPCFLPTCPKCPKMPSLPLMKSAEFFAHFASNPSFIPWLSLNLEIWEIKLSKTLVSRI